MMGSGNTGRVSREWMVRGILIVTAIALALAQAVTSAKADPVRHAGELRGRHVSPPVQSNGIGTAQTALMGNELTWLVSFFGLPESATAVHIHGPAKPGETAAVLFDVAANGMDTVMAGQTTLTDTQRAELLAGLWYVNVHTPGHPGGELRAQLLPFE